MDTISPTYMSTFRFSKLIHVQGSHCVVKLEIWSFQQRNIISKIISTTIDSTIKKLWLHLQALFWFFFGNKTTEHFDLTITKEVQEK